MFIALKKNIFLKKFHGSGDTLRIGQEIQYFPYAGFFCLNTKLILGETHRFLVVNSMIPLKFLDKDLNS